MGKSILDNTMARLCVLTQIAHSEEHHIFNNLTKSVGEMSKEFGSTKFVQFAMKQLSELTVGHGKWWNVIMQYRLQKYTT